VSLISCKYHQEYHAPVHAAGSLCNCWGQRKGRENAEEVVA
jgi:hypothetical protein